MRYILQVVAMLGDVAILFAVGTLVYLSIDNPALRLITLILSVVTYRVWYSQGAFAAWKPSNIRKFLDKAKKQGL